MRPPGLQSIGTNDPLIMKDGMTMFAGASHDIPVDHQVPYAEQFCLGSLTEQEKFNSLLRDVFKKDAIIWSLDKNWNSEGDCIIAVFYSRIVPPTDTDPDLAGVSVGKVTSEFVMETPQEKEDRLFNAFVEAKEAMKEEEDEC